MRRSKLVNRFKLVIYYVLSIVSMMMMLFRWLVLFYFLVLVFCFSLLLFFFGVLFKSISLLLEFAWSVGLFFSSFCCCTRDEVNVFASFHVVFSRLISLVSMNERAQRAYASRFEQIIGVRLGSC